MFSRRSTRQTLLVLLTAALLLTACNVGATPAPTLDVNAMSTALVGTTIAQLSVQYTQTALAMPTNTPAPTQTQVVLPTIALPTLDTSGAASPTLDAAALPTFSFVNTPVTGGSAATQAPVVLPTSQGAQPTASFNDACNSLAFEGDATIPDGTVLAPGTNFVKQWAVKNTGNCTWDDGYTLVYIGGTKPDLDPVNFKFTQKSDFVAPGQGINLGVTLTTPCTPGKYNGTWRMQSDNGYYFGTPLSVYVEVTEKCK
ncbi:MAG: NBR1-Ig-like domain-containing protein [Chloroflexota bacterium]